MTLLAMFAGLMVLLVAIAIIRNACVCQHDWEVFEEGEFDDGDHFLRYFTDIPSLERRICLRCGEIDDGIAKYRARRDKLKEEKERRRNRVEELLNRGASK